MAYTGEPEFYTHHEEGSEYIWLGVISRGSVCAKRYTVAEWLEWVDKNMPRLSRERISSAWTNWSDY